MLLAIAIWLASGLIIGRAFLPTVKEAVSHMIQEPEHARLRENLVGIEAMGLLDTLLLLVLSILGPTAIYSVADAAYRNSKRRKEVK